MDLSEQDSTEDNARHMDESAEPVSHGTGYVVLLWLVLLGVGVRVNRLGTAGAISLSEVFVLLAALLILVHALLHPRSSVVRIDRPMKYLAAFLLWAALSQFWALRPEVVPMELFAITLKAMIYGLVLACTITERALKYWAHLFMLMSFGFLASVVWERFLLGGFDAAAEQAGGWQWIISFGFWSAFLLIINVHGVLFGRNWVARAVAGLGVMANLAVVYLIDQRAPLLVVPIELLVYAIIFRKHHRAIVPATVIVALALPLVVLSNPKLTERVVRGVNDVGANLTGQERAAHDILRYMQYRVSIACIRENYLVGVGLGSLRYWADEMYGWRVFWPHSLVLRITGELGIPGLLLFGGFVLSALNRGWVTCRGLLRRHRLHEASLVGALISAAIGMMVYAQIQPMLKEMPVYLSLSLLSAAAAIYRSTATDTEPVGSAQSGVS